MPAISTVRFLRRITKKAKYRTNPPMVRSSNREEVSRRQAAPMSGQERFPGRLRAALGCGFDAVVLEDRLDRVAGHFVAETLQRAADSRVAPRRVLVRHADHEGGDIRLGAGATGDSLLRAGVFPGDEPAVPTEDRVRGDDARDAPETTPTEGLSIHSEAAPLVGSEPEPTGTALGTLHAVFLAQVVDDRLLLAVDPAREQKEEEGERGRQRVHGPQLSHGAPTLQGWPGTGDVEPVAGWTSRARP